MKKRIITIIAIIFAAGVMAEAQQTPPTVNQGPVSTTHNKQVQGTNQGPVGTATALLVTLGAGAVAYKVRKNKRQEN
ncbi:MAG: hypothetical protein II878_04595 [Bacteroidales bacterium]|nr:hypothetical protein [Bacteroidales bacterium]